MTEWKVHKLTKEVEELKETQKQLLEAVNSLTCEVLALKHGLEETREVANNPFPNYGASYP